MLGLRNKSCSRGVLIHHGLYHCHGNQALTRPAWRGSDSIRNPVLAIRCTSLLDDTRRMLIITEKTSLSARPGNCVMMAQRVTNCQVELLPWEVRHVALRPPIAQLMAGISEQSFETPQSGLGSTFLQWSRYRPAFNRTCCKRR